MSLDSHLLTNKRHIFLNASLSIIYNIVNAFSMFFVYRFLLISLGIDLLGIWSLVLASTSFFSIANFGLSGSLVKFIPKYIALSDNLKLSDTIQTVALSMLGILFLILVPFYPISILILQKLIPANFFPLTQHILPFGVASIFLMLMSGVFQSCLDGCGRIDLRNYLNIAGTLLHLLLVFLLVPYYGLIGAAYAKVLHNSFLLLSFFISAKIIFPFLPTFFIRWKKEIFREIIGYGGSLQLISIFHLFYDPITKAFLSKYGSLAYVGYFEMANKLFYQFHILILSSYQVLVASISYLYETASDKLYNLYILSVRIAFFVALPLVSIIISSLYFISDIWLGHQEPLFIFFGSLLGIGYLLNIVAFPSYIYFMGIGILKWNVTGKLFIALFNTILGFFLGFIIGGNGVVIGWVLAMSIGSLIPLIAFHFSYNLSLKIILYRETIYNLCLLIIIISLNILGLFIFNINYIYFVNFLYILFISILLIIINWHHPLRSTLINNLLKLLAPEISLSR